jgi:hypothetical protein
MRIGFIWLRIRWSGGHAWSHGWSFGFLILELIAVPQILKKVPAPRSKWRRILPCQYCVWRAAIFLPCTLHAVTRQMKCTHRRLSSECHYRCHNNPHQSELLKASCWSVILHLHARIPAVCCSYLLKCVPQGDRKLVTDKTSMRHVGIPGSP